MYFKSRLKETFILQLGQIGGINKITLPLRLLKTDYIRDPPF